MADNKTTQMSLLRLEGFNTPFTDCIPNTIVAESPEVIKKMEIKMRERRDVIKLIGISFNVPNSICSVFIEAKSAIPVICISIAVPPKKANQINVTMVGTSNTPIVS